MEEINELEKTIAPFDFMAVEKLLQFIESFKSDREARNKMLDTLALTHEDLRSFGPQMATRIFWVYNNIKVLIERLDTYEPRYASKVLTRQ